MRVAQLGASLAVVVALSAAPAVGQHMNAKDAPCRDVVITSDMAACFSSALRSRSRELDTLLGEVRTAVGGDELGLLNRAQSAWIEYRKQSCAGEYAMYEGGSAGPTVRLACLDALTRDRIKQLHTAYDWRVQKHQWTVEHPNSGQP